MVKFTWAVFKRNWKRYAWSSLLSFLAGFLMSFAFAFKELTFDNLEAAGMVGSVVLVGRLVLKAVFEGIQYLLPILVEKLTALTQKVKSLNK